MATSQPAPAVQLPAHCPTCHSSDRRQLDFICIQPIAGTLPDGTEFKQVTWLQVECLTCGQRYRVRRYENRGEPATI